MARNFESTGGFDQTIKDFDSLNPIDVKEIQTQYGPGKVGKLSDGTTVVALELKNIINKEYPINADLNISIPFDVTKIASSETNTVLDTVEKVGKAYAELFATKVQEEIAKKLTEVRSLNTKFEGETEVVL